MTTRLPHAIPYQGSKRKLAPTIARYYPDGIETLYEPFCGSAAMTIYAAHHNLAERFVLGDSLEPIVKLLEAIVERPTAVADQYEEIWNGQGEDNPRYFYEVRERFNEDRDPVDMLYLICRCVKNAVRFGKNGNFSQSVDKRRLGTQPAKMRSAVNGVSAILKGRCEYRVGDWKDTCSTATSRDLVYMDPPYMGTSNGRDNRYFQQLAQEELVVGLDLLLERKVPFALSYDGMTGEKTYGPPLPERLGLVQLLLDAGRSSQATLSGEKQKTLESLYLSPGLATPSSEVILAEPRQNELQF